MYLLLFYERNTMQKTLAIIKPDAVKAHNVGKIITMLEENGMKILAMKMVHLTRKQAEGFYAVHQGKPFFEGLIQLMTSVPVIIMVLEGHDIIVRYRTLMGATNPANAASGTIRALYATDVEKNAVHGSDSEESAVFEISYFFNIFEITGQ